MASDPLDDNMINDVVQHMNEDHADACLAIVHALGGIPEASSARMTGMDATAVEFSATLSDNRFMHIRVRFDKPITHARQIRGHLVSMTKRARNDTQKSHRTPLSDG